MIAVQNSSIVWQSLVSGAMQFTYAVLSSTDNAITFSRVKGDVSRTIIFLTSFAMDTKPSSDKLDGKNRAIRGIWVVLIVKKKKLRVRLAQTGKVTAQQK
jgi:hypothetical protein